jgi:hypothetical protein
MAMAGVIKHNAIRPMAAAKATSPAGAIITANAIADASEKTPASR